MWQAAKRVDREVARRIELIGGDESQWPQAAKDSISRQSKKLDAIHDVVSRLQSELDYELHNLATEQSAKQSLQVVLLSCGALQRLLH